MSFPRLILKGNTAIGTVTSIELQYVNSDPAVSPHALIRRRYDIRRELSYQGSQQTPLRYPDVPFDRYRTVHNWVGSVDVITESVVPGFGDPDTLALLKNGILLLDNNQGIQHSIVYTPMSDQGALNPSINIVYADLIVNERAEEWKYDAANLNLTVRDWIINSINIVDNQNQTSTVTFEFEYKTPWVNLTTLIQNTL